MCYHNFTQQVPTSKSFENSLLIHSHNGCGHIGESHHQPWTLCDTAMHRLNDLRGPMSPPLSPPASNSAPVKRSSSTRRFFSLSQTMSRSASTASRRTVSSPEDARDSNGYFSPTAFPEAATLNYATLPDHQLKAVRCCKPTKRTQISREMNVCKECKRWIGDMRSMIERFDKTGSIRGTAAFEAFMRWQGEGGGESEGDLTVPLNDSVDGVALGAREAIILGHPEGQY
ncbi:hypothetical protein EKO04_007643 [Ascochyta lentis]|uniref:Uncharacterized protein n=1 Tax=Ascochyta lentis TaxID=205686 RepID=A0A8H7MCK6_9PLEO|nr:hypothetical protein EKO04_007643 [Ascochyta lentis]